MPAFSERTFSYHGSDPKAAGRSRLVHALAAFCFLASIASAGRSATGESSTGDTPSSLLWRDQSHTEAMFIPEDLLHAVDFSSSASADLSRLPLSQLAAESLREVVFDPALDARSRRGRNDECYPLPHLDSFVDEPKPGSVSYADMVMGHEVAVVGIVRQTVPGWHAQLRRVVTLVHVEVDEILHNKRPGGALPEVFTYLQFSGAMSFAGVKRCTSSEGFYEASPGDRILVSGNVDRFNPTNFFVFVFQIVGDEIRSEPHASMKSEATTLVRLRRDIELLTADGGNLGESQ